MSAKHSPGPWKTSELDRRAVEGADGIVVADVRSWRDTDDAVLIAAAPEMLALLREILSGDDAEGDYGRGIGGESADRIRALLARIDGTHPAGK